MAQSPESTDPSTKKGKPARPRRSRRWLRVLLILLAAAVAGLVAFLLLKGPATPEPDRIIPQPDANSASLKDSERASLFDNGDKFTFLQPASAVWATGATTAPGTMVYSDVTSCNPAAASCPTVTFVDLSTPGAQKFLGDKPLDWWAQRNICETGDKILEGSEEFDTDGETTRYYRIPCGVEGENTVHAWFIPGKDLLIFTSTGEGGSFSAEILKTVMDSIRWK